jgi:hypothetical protein
MIKLKNAVTVILITGLSLILGTCEKNPVTSGGSETQNGIALGKLYNKNGTPAVGARVKFIPVDNTPSPAAKKTAATDSTVTDSNGDYSVSEVPAGEYNIFGDKDGKLSYLDSIIIKKDQENHVPVDTLRDPGSITGVIGLQPGHNSKTVLILVMGTTIFSFPSDSIGNFTLANIAKGVYNAHIITTMGNYLPVDTQFTIIAGQADTLADTIWLPYTGVTTPSFLKAVYDTLNGRTILTWNKPRGDRVAGYMVFRNEFGSAVPVLINGTTLVTDTFYVDPVAVTSNTVFEYRIKAQDDNANQSEVYSSAAIIMAVPARCVRTLISAAWEPFMIRLVLTIR